MNVIGKWKILKLGITEPGGLQIKLVTHEEIAANERIDEDIREEYMRNASCLMEFLPDGTLRTLFPIPEGMEEAAKEDGMEIVGNHAVIESTQWKEVDGNILVNLKIEGEVLGDKVDPFSPIEIVDDDHIIYNMGLVLLERI